MGKDDAQPAAETTSPEPSQPAAVYANFVAKYEKKLGQLEIPAKISAIHYGKVARKKGSATIEFVGYRIDFNRFEDILKKEAKEIIDADQSELLVCLGDPKCGERIRAIRERHDKSIEGIMNHEHSFKKIIFHGRWTDCKYKISDLVAHTYTEMDPDAEKYKSIIEVLKAAEEVNEYEKSLNNKVE